MELNAYHIHWAILKPIKGIITKKDTSLGFSIDFRKKFLVCHAPNLIEAKKKVSNLEGKLSKCYKVFFITDKQFGMTTKKLSYEDLATKKQLEKNFVIK